MELNASYLDMLTRIENPSPDYEDGDVCDEYCQIRNYAKDLLRNPEDGEIRTRLSGLIERLEIKLK